MISFNGRKEISHRQGLAVVTGAAGGLGAAYAQSLAARGYDLLLVDRRHEPLCELCEKICHRYEVSAEPRVADFAQRDQVKQLASELAQLNELTLLINNAGFGNIDHFVDTDPEVIAAMVDVHVIAPMLLTRAVLPGMLERHVGGVINVSSLSAWFQSAATHITVLPRFASPRFTMSLHQELRGSGVRVQALCPGFVRTQFHDAESMKEFKRSPQLRACGPLRQTSLSSR